MRALEYVEEVDESGRLHVDLPSGTPAGPVRVLILLPETKEDEADSVWMSGVARELADELADERQDIYTLNDGEPVNASR